MKMFVKKLLVYLFLGVFLFTNFSVMVFAGNAEPTPEELNAYFEYERQVRKAKEQADSDQKKFDESKTELKAVQESTQKAINENIDKTFADLKTKKEILDNIKANAENPEDYEGASYEDAVKAYESELERKATEKSTQSAINENIDKTFKDLKTKKEALDYIKANAENPEDYEGASYEDAVKAYESELERKAAEESAAGAVDKSVAEIKAERDAAKRSQELEEAVDEANSRTTILPSTTIGTEDCKSVMNHVLSNSREIKQNIFEQAEQSIVETVSVGGKSFNLTAKAIMGCAVKTGQIKLWMIPYFVRQFLEFIITLAGLVAVGGIVYGGYLYMFAGVSDDKEKGKKAIMYAVAGMVLTMVAWAFVNIVISIVT